MEASWSPEENPSSVNIDASGFQTQHIIQTLAGVHPREVAERRVDVLTVAWRTLTCILERGAEARG